MRNHTKGPVQTHIINTAGEITLNYPRAVNACNFNKIGKGCCGVNELLKWYADDAVGNHFKGEQISDLAVKFKG